MANSCEEYVLERLEKLEKENEELKKEIKGLEEKNGKLKDSNNKLIEICKDVEKEINFKDDGSYISLYFGKTYIGLADKKNMINGSPDYVATLVKFKGAYNEQASIKSES